MTNEEYDKLVSSVIKEESHARNFFIAFFSGGFLAVLGELLSKFYLKIFSISVLESYMYVSLTLVIIGSLLTGLGFFDKILSIFKCGLIVPTTGFANSLTSAALDVRKEGFIKGIGANIFKLAGSVILYGIVFGTIFGLLRGIAL